MTVPAPTSITGACIIYAGKIPDKVRLLGWGSDKNQFSEVRARRSLTDLLCVHDSCLRCVIDLFCSFITWYVTWSYFLTYR